MRHLLPFSLALTFYASGHSNAGVSSKPFALDSIPALRSGFYLVLSDSTGLTGFNAYYKDSSYYLSQYPAFTFTQVDSLSKKYDRNLKSYLLFFHLDKSASSLWEYFTIRNIGHQVAVILDNKIIWVATIEEPLHNAYLAGNFTEQQIDSFRVLTEREIKKPIRKTPY